MKATVNPVDQHVVTLTIEVPSKSRKQAWIPNSAMGSSCIGNELW